MESLKLYDKQDIRFEQTVMPQVIKETDVIVEIKAVGICGSDISRYRKLGPYVEGMVFGHEFSGIVVEVGSKVKKVEIGDRVSGCPALICEDLDVDTLCYYCQKSEFARCENLTVIGARHPGAFAEYISIPEKNAITIPDNLDYETAAMVEPSAVVVHGYYHTDITVGDDVIVVGCGNMGILAIKWAKLFGAKKVIAIDISDEALAVAKNAGADEIINSFSEDTLAAVEKMTNNLGADIVVEAAGSRITSAEVCAYAKKGGGVLFLGIPYADITIERFYFEKIVRSELTIWGSWNAISAIFPGKEWETTVHFMSTGQLEVKSMITHRLDLSDGPKIFERIINNTNNEKFGKVMFYPSGKEGEK